MNAALRSGWPVTALALAGAAWLGAVGLFVMVVAPAAFAVLPSSSLAGALVGRVLPPLFFGGMVAGLAAFVVAVGGRPRVTRAAMAGFLAAACCAIAQFVVGSALGALRMEIGGPLDALATGDPRRSLFGRLHLASVALLGAAAVCMMVVVVDATRMARSGAR